MPRITPIILCGGKGERLWPLSRESMPKQFVKFAGDLSLFQQTCLRFCDDIFEEPVIVTAEEHRFTVVQQLAEIKTKCHHIILEPIPKDTAPAILAACEFISSNKSDALVFVAPCDHLMPHSDKKIPAILRQVLKENISKKLIIFGITPTNAHTGYGYIKTLRNSTLVSQFKEKPGKLEAQKMIEDRAYLWNSGMFLFEVSTLFALAKKYENAMLNSVRDAVKFSLRDLDFYRLNETEWRQTESKSFDYSILEKAESLCCFHYGGIWSDLGDWKSFWETQAKTANGNTIIGDVYSLNCRNSLFYSTPSNKMVVGLGLSNLIVINMDDVVLLAPMEEAQAIKDVVINLKHKKISQATNHLRDYRPWGWFDVLAQGIHHQIKRLHVAPKESLSLQSHKFRSEHWIVISGSAEVQIGREIKIVQKNESVFIPAGKKHRLSNNTETPLVLIEVQTGDYLAEDDIIRYDDLYGR